jgi:hypothetical protein
MWRSFSIASYEFKARVSRSKADLVTKVKLAADCICRKGKCLLSGYRLMRNGGISLQSSESNQFQTPALVTRSSKGVIFSTHLPLSAYRLYPWFDRLIFHTTCPIEPCRHPTSSVCPLPCSLIVLELGILADQS